MKTIKSLFLLILITFAFSSFAQNVIEGTVYENVDGKLNGISSFLSDVSSGNGGEMLGGFLGTLTHGNVSGLGIMGLVLSAFLVFGRFGWLAKLAGAMLAMMTIGNNSARALSPAAVQPSMAGDVRQAEVGMRPEVTQETEQIHRRR